MIASLLQRARDHWTSWIKAAPGWWRESWPAPRAATQGLDIPLLPSPLAQWAARTLIATQLLYAAELVLLGHGFVAGMVVVLAACSGWWLSPRRGDHRQARRLLVTADGRMYLLGASGTLHGVRLHPASLRLGPWLLLRMQGNGVRHVALLGPDNLPAEALATLRRRLQMPATGG